MTGVIPAARWRSETGRAEDVDMHGDVATQELREEHDRILEVLELMGELLSREGDSFESSRLADRHAAFGAFLEEFADRYHHAKEESLLFVEARSLLAHCDPIAQMLYEHEVMRELRRAMDEAYRKRDLDALVDACATLCEALEQHIRKENFVLYPMIEHGISDEARATLAAGYAAVRDRDGGPALHARCDALCEALRADLA